MRADSKKRQLNTAAQGSKKGIWRLYGSAAVGFAVLLTGLFGHILLPDKQLSEMERRRLAQAPEITAENVASGVFMDAFESYLEDQFPFRQNFRQMRAWIWNQIYRMEDNHGVFVRQGYAARRQEELSQYDEQRFCSNVKQIRNALPKAASWNVAVIPDKEEYLRREGEYYPFDYSDMLMKLREDLPETEVSSMLELLDRNSYYRTDIHLTQEGAAVAAAFILEKLGAENIPDYKEWGRHEIPGFYGSLYGIGALSLPPDTIVYLTSDATEAANVWHLETDKVTSVYDLEKLTEGTSLDKYDIFLSGADAFSVITNPLSENDRELIIFRDSFGSSIAPLLLPAYSKITLVDLRYISLPEALKRIEADGADILFLYGIQSVNHASNMKIR